MLLFIFLLCVVAYIIYIKFIFISPAVYWQKKGIFHVKPWTRLVDVFFSSKSFFEIVVEIYHEFPDRRYYGSYHMFSPSLFVRDLDLIKQITIKDFDHFTDHVSIINEKVDSIVTKNLFSLKGEKWKEMRSTLSPAFTSSKMRSMYTLIRDSAENFAEYFLQKGDDVIEMEMKNIYSRFTNDVIANCAFGVKCDSLREENNEFYTMGSNLTNPNGLRALRAIVAQLIPKIFEFFRIPLFPTYVVEFFQKLISETISYRERKNIIRPDMIHLLMEARKGRLKHETDKVDDKDTGFATVEESSLGKSSVKSELTDDIIVAQAVVFFFAGFDTTSTMLSFMSYELAVNPDIQTRLQNEIDDALDEENGKLSYEGILKMKYLDQVISETMRKYPPGYVLTRVCTKDYKIEAKNENEIDFVINKGCFIAIPAIGLHMDPKFFPEPYKFDPDRFSDENKGNIVPGSYMPFGSGPRNCIGSRFALLEGKALAVSLLSRFDILPTKKTTIPLKFAKNFNVAIKNGCWLGLKKRN